MTASSDPRPKLLVLNAVGWPGNLATGPNRSLAAVYEGLGEDFSIRVCVPAPPAGAPGAAPHGPGSAHPPTTLFRRGRAAVADLRRALADQRPDIVWTQNVVSPGYTLAPLLLRKAGLAGRAAFVASPRGELSPAALASRARAKRAYFGLIRTAGLMRGVTLHATSAIEKADIERLKIGGRLAVAADTAVLEPLPPHVPAAAGQPLRVAYLGRIHPMKGLDVALRSLAAARADIALDIFGPVQDAEYKARCDGLIGALPASGKARYAGVLRPDEVVGTMAGYDLMFLPSRSESFGHAIFEALSAGTPVLIGDRTPWTDLEAGGAGWVRPVDDFRAFAERLDAAAARDTAARDNARTCARALVEKRYSTAAAISETREMLLHALGAPGR